VTSLTGKFSGTDTSTLTIVHTSLKSVLAVFVGGLVGSAARIGITLVAGQIDDYWWPYPTLVINLVGSFALGYLVARGMPSLPSWMRLGVTTGFLGSIILGLVCAIAGLRLGARRAAAT
jgi:hypothetical protein